MYCRNCGKELKSDNAVICVECGSKVGTGNKFCCNCGHAIKENSAVCLNCGVSQFTNQHFTNNTNLEQDVVTPDKCKTSPTVAAVLSVLLVGLGQMINGQLIKGLLMLICAIIIGSITGGVGAVVAWIISGIDAYKCAEKLNNGESIGKFSFF